ncbi:hypothetical protein B4133_3657 [Bacillus altitudinis]|nr:hypothetical protein B4133_3657 [Bacillus altitudinis]
MPTIRSFALTLFPLHHIGENTYRALPSFILLYLPVISKTIEQLDCTQLYLYCLFFDKKRHG